MSCLRLFYRQAAGSGIVENLVHIEREAAMTFEQVDAVSDQTASACKLHHPRGWKPMCNRKIGNCFGTYLEHGVN